MLRIQNEVSVLTFKMANYHRRDAFLKNCPLLALPFRKNIFPLPTSVHVFIASWKYEQQMILYKTIYYYNKNEK